MHMATLEIDGLRQWVFFMSSAQHVDNLGLYIQVLVCLLVWEKYGYSLTANTPPLD